MAAIQTIRKYSGLAVGLIGISILAFVISDALQTDNQPFRRKKNNVGEIDGKSINFQEFHNRLEGMIAQVKEQQQIENVDEKTQSQIRDQLWQTLIDEILFINEYKKSGVNVSSDELAYMVTGPEPHPSVKQAFTDPKTGIFDRDQLINFLKNYDKDARYKNMWMEFEDNLEKERLRQKYYTLVKNSFFVSDVEATDEYYSRNKFASFQYIALPLASIPDSTIKPSRKELEKYLKDHSQLYQIEESRSIEYISFDIIPTKEDSMAVLTKMSEIRKEFVTTANDSLFVEVNSESHFDTNFHPRGFLPKALEDSLFNLPNAKVVGPLFDNNLLKIAKLISVKNDTVFYYRASHILIRPAGATDNDTLMAMVKARNLMTEIRGGANFASKAMEISEDKSSGANGGDLNWFKDGAMVKPFMDAVKNGRKGDMIVVKTQFGAHLIKITEDKTNKIYKIGVIQKSITPSDKTINAAYFNANKFKSQIEKKEEFLKKISENGMNKKIASDIKPDAQEITGMTNSRRVINWMYSAKLNQLSDVIDLDVQYIVAVVTKVNSKGTAPLDDVLDEITKKVIAEKKRDQLFEKLNTEREKNNDIQKIATALNTKVENATNIGFGVPFLPNLGEEKMFVGYVFGSQKGKLSQVIRGENGVFVFILSDFSKVEAPKDLKQIRQEMTSNYQGMSQYYCMESLKESANIMDYRYRFY